jgi:hypothetical protein
MRMGDKKRWEKRWEFNIGRREGKGDALRGGKTVSTRQNAFHPPGNAMHAPHLNQKKSPIILKVGDLHF